MPQEYTQLKTNYINFGSRRDLPTDIRSGFVHVQGGSGEGQKYRSGFGSDDKTYNQGSDEAYVIRPSRSIANRFRDGGEAFIRRYSDPPGQREQWVSQLDIIRQVVQHMNMLKYAAEFSAENNAAFQVRLNELMNELVADNIIDGMICQNDEGNENSCTSDQLFMMGALDLDFLRSYLNNWGDINGEITAGITTYAQQLYDLAASKDANGNVIFDGNWDIRIRCDFNNGLRTNCQGFTGPQDDIVLEQEVPLHLSVMLMAHQLDPSINLCVPARDSFPSALLLPDFLGNYLEGPGWWKGAAQSMRDVVHGIAIADACDGTPTQPPPPPPSQIIVVGDVTAAEAGTDGSDNEIDVNDILRTVDHIIDPTNSALSVDAQTAADTNCDANINILDVLRIVDKVINPTLDLSC